MPDWSASAPLAVFYGVLVVNTWFSIRCFSALIPSGDPIQRGLDAVLALVYVALAASLSTPVQFAAIAVLLFSVATCKYALLLGRLESMTLLVSKVRLDALGTIACALALTGMVAGHGPLAGWGLAIVTILANLWILCWRPLYRPRPEAPRAAIVEGRATASSRNRALA